jgi:putative transposase
VERNPVRAGIVRRPWQYQWSSARWHAGEVTVDPLVTGDEVLRGLISNWREYLGAVEDEIEIATIRRECQGGRPVGSDEFVQELEARLKRSLIRGKPGRHWHRKSVAVPD